VLDVQIFSTVVVTDDGTRVIIPNNVITSGTVKVFAPPSEQVAAEPVAAGAHAA
jgi:small-conductance mechanosensitive channel